MRGSGNCLARRGVPTSPCLLFLEDFFVCGGPGGGISPSTDKFRNDNDDDDDVDVDVDDVDDYDDDDDVDDDDDDDVDDDDDDDEVDDNGEFRCFQLWRRQPVVILSSPWAVLSRWTFSFS